MTARTFTIPKMATRGIPPTPILVIECALSQMSFLLALSTIAAIDGNSIGIYSMKLDETTASQPVYARIAKSIQVTIPTRAWQLTGVLNLGLTLLRKSGVSRSKDHAKIDLVTTISIAIGAHSSHARNDANMIASTIGFAVITVDKKIKFGETGNGYVPVLYK